MNGISLKQLTETLVCMGSLKDLKASSLLTGDEFFAGLDEKTLTDAAGSINLASFKAGDIICRHGKFDEKFYLILNGAVRAVIPTETIRVIFYTASEGVIFSERKWFFQTLPGTIPL
jgi:CRP-like cAMP-binding protein